MKDLIQRGRRRLLLTTVVVIVIVAVLSTWLYFLSPAGRVSSLAQIKRVAINGAISGATFALLAVGFTLIYGVAEVANMAHGALYMLGAFMFFSFGHPLGFFDLEAPLALILAVISVAVVGSIIYRLTIHPVVEDPLAVMVVTVAVTLILQQLVLIQWPAIGVPIPSFTKEFCEAHNIPNSLTILGVGVTYDRLLAFASSLVLFAILSIFIAKTKIGKAMKAVAQDREVAMLLGINTERLYMLTMAISASFAAIAGIMTTAGYSVTYSLWMAPLYMSFSIVILGGLGSIKGSLVGGFIVGYAGQAAVSLNPAWVHLRGAVALAIMVLVLLLRPRGLFGKRIELEE